MLRSSASGGIQLVQVLGGNQHVLFRPFWDEVQSVSDSCVLSCCLDRLGEYPTWCEKNHHLAPPLLQKPLL